MYRCEYCRRRAIKGQTECAGCGAPVIHLPTGLGFEEADSVSAHGYTDHHQGINTELATTSYGGGVRHG